MDDFNLQNVVLDNEESICYISDLDTFDLLYINDLGRELFKIKGDEYKGKKCYSVLQGNSEKCSFCNNDRLCKNKVVEKEHYNKLIGKQFQLLDTIIEWQGKDVRMELAIDISSRKNEIDNLKNKLLFEETLLKCAQALSLHKNMNVAINKLLEIICNFFGADRSYIFEISEDGNFVNNTYEFAIDGVKTEIANLQLVPYSFVASWFEKFENQGEFYINSLNEDEDIQEDTYNILEPQGIESLLAAPLIIDNKFIGFLGVDNPKSITIDTSLLRSVTLFVTSELEKKEINDKLNESVNYDSFTGIYNRNKYITTLDNIIAKRQEPVGVIYLDIDGLKKANDDYGHEYGDMIILKIVDLLKTYFPYELFRIGGDEFIGFYYDNNKNEFDEKVKELVKIIDTQEEISASIGSIWCNDPKNIIENIVSADELMYLDKQEYYKIQENKEQNNHKTNSLSTKEHKSLLFQTDLLTGCLNKQSTEYSIKKIISTCVDKNCVLFVLGLQNFGEINECFGHLAGDKVLRDIGVSLRKFSVKEDIVGRVTGGKFVLFLNKLDNLFLIKQLAEKIIYVVTKNLITHDESVRVSCSVGISRLIKDGDTYEELFDKACSMQRVAKHNDNKQYLVYSKEIKIKENFDDNRENNEKIYISNKSNNDILLKTLNLLSSENKVENSIKDILKMIASEYDVSRVNIFELASNDNVYNCTYEWCGDYISLNTNNLHDISFERLINNFDEYINDCIVICNDIRDLKCSNCEVIESLGIKSFLQTYENTSNMPRFIINIADCQKPRHWTDSEVMTLKYLSNLLIMSLKQSRIIESIDISKQFENLDTLTSISTKEKFYKDTTNMLNKHQDKNFFLMLINVNKFQMFNTFFGIDEGDRLLKLIAKDLEVLTENNLSTFGRVGGDIFCVCQQLVKPIEVAAKSLTNTLAKCFDNYRFDYNLSSSIGFYLIEDFNTPIEIMYSKAFLAAKKIKYVKSTAYSIYEDLMQQEEVNEQSIINDMEFALTDKQFEVYLQPKVKLDTDDIIGAEALVRWNHPLKGFITPIDFIPIFEKNGLICKLDYFVWETVFKLLHSEIENNQEVFPVSVNVSRADLFNKNTLPFFKELLKKYNVPVKLVHLEITESAYIEDYEEIGTLINQLKELGFHIEMDDFGTGYSSLNMFSEMIVDTLKLDMNFLKDLQNNGDKHDVLSFIVSLAKNFNLPVVAEGIETVEQLSFLRTMGCDIGQGYYFSKPLPIPEFLKFKNEWKNKKITNKLNVNDEFMDIQDILYPNQQMTTFFEKGLGATGIFKVTNKSIKTVRFNDDLNQALGIFDRNILYKNDIQQLFHKEYVNLLFENLKQAKCSRKPSIFDAKLLNPRDDDSNTFAIYNDFHICIKIINTNQLADMYLITFELLN